MYWLSCGLGVNSTALAVLLVEGKLPEFTPYRFLFADTGDEKPETYAYARDVFVPYLRRHGYDLEVCRDRESVLERWERLAVVGSRILRTCTLHAKIRPIKAYIRDRDPGPVQLIGIDAGEPHRARPVADESRDHPKRYPLVELGIDRRSCAAIIRGAGLCLPVKSGCWHCPFMRKREVLDLAKNAPEKMRRIIELEEASLLVHPVDPGRVRAQWSERPGRAILAPALAEQQQGWLPIDLGSDPEDAACGCYDG